MRPSRNSAVTAAPAPARVLDDSGFSDRNTSKCSPQHGVSPANGARAAGLSWVRSAHTTFRRGASVVPVSSRAVQRSGSPASPTLSSVSDRSLFTATR
ncbi:Uncharacterised protein [Mycobacteroides abscessus subsp. abscessus]|nr:Uncharacterised protein [Mycobacteroides abscessus subsp. abscessus]